VKPYGVLKGQNVLADTLYYPTVRTCLLVSVLQHTIGLILGCNWSCCGRRVSKSSNPAIAVTSHCTASVTHTYKGPPATTVTTICYTQYLTNLYLRNKRLLVSTINTGGLSAPKAPCPWIPRHYIQMGCTEKPKRRANP